MNDYEVGPGAAGGWGPGKARGQGVGVWQDGGLGGLRVWGFENGWPGAARGRPRAVAHNPRPRDRRAKHNQQQPTRGRRGARAGACAAPPPAFVPRRACLPAAAFSRPASTLGAPSLPACPPACRQVDEDDRPADPPRILVGAAGQRLGAAGCRKAGGKGRCCFSWAGPLLTPPQVGGLAAGGGVRRRRPLPCIVSPPRASLSPMHAQPPPFPAAPPTETAVPATTNGNLPGPERGGDVEPF
jgi:hypothetical protein